MGIAVQLCMLMNIAPRVPTIWKGLPRRKWRKNIENKNVKTELTETGVLKNYGRNVDFISQQSWSQTTLFVRPVVILGTFLLTVALSNISSWRHRNNCRIKSVPRNLSYSEKKMKKSRKHFTAFSNKFSIQAPCLYWALLFCFACWWTLSPCFPRSINGFLNRRQN